MKNIVNSLLVLLGLMTCDLSAMELFFLFRREGSNINRCLFTPGVSSNEFIVDGRVFLFDLIDIDRCLAFDLKDVMVLNAENIDVERICYDSREYIEAYKVPIDNLSLKDVKRIIDGLSVEERNAAIRSLKGDIKCLLSKLSSVLNLLAIPSLGIPRRIDRTHKYCEFLYCKINSVHIDAYIGHEIKHLKNKLKIVDVVGELSGKGLPDEIIILVFDFADFWPWYERRFDDKCRILHSAKIQAQSATHEDVDQRGSEVGDDSEDSLFRQNTPYGLEIPGNSGPLGPFSSCVIQ